MIRLGLRPGQTNVQTNVKATCNEKVSHGMLQGTFGMTVESPCVGDGDALYTVRGNRLEVVVEVTLVWVTVDRPET